MKVERQDNIFWLSGWAQQIEVKRHEETFFAKKSKAPIHEVEQPRKPSQRGKVKC